MKKSITLLLTAAVVIYLICISLALLTSQGQQIFMNLVPVVVYSTMGLVATAPLVIIYGLVRTIHFLTRPRAPMTGITESLPRNLEVERRKRVKN